ncbi:MAG: flagellar basal body P-ring protein FlgI [Phycisphaeraceae bacterium]
MSAIVALLSLLVMTGAARGVSVQDLVRVKGAEKSKLIGMGLVVGLNGTGDGGKFLPAMRPLAVVIQQLIDPNTVAAELKDAKNVALVAISANLPESGVREGDHVDVHLAAVGAAKSLQGGRLFLIPLTGPLPNSPIYAFAEGAVTVQDPKMPTVAMVPQGAQLVRDVRADVVNDGQITLVINEEVAGWPMANNIANLVNGIMAPNGPNLAKAADPRNVVIFVPDYERRDPAAFISQILQSYVDTSQITTGARVTINKKTGTIVLSGDVQISPVVISHKGLTITTITPPPAPNTPQVEEKNFIAIDPDKRGGEKLSDLLAVLNQLKVEPADRIAIIQEIHKSGKLHAKLILE